MPTYSVKLKIVEEIDFGIINTTSKKGAFEKAKEKLSTLFGQNTALEEIKRKIKCEASDDLELHEDNNWNIEEFPIEKRFEYLYPEKNNFISSREIIDRRAHKSIRKKYKKIR